MIWVRAFRFLLLFFSFSLGAIEQENVVNHYRICNDNSTIFKILQDGEPFGYIRKAKCFLLSCSYYDFYDRFGIYNGSGSYSQSCDHISDCFEQLDISNGSGKSEGCILLYDPYEILIGQIRNSENETIALATFRFYPDQNQIDCSIYSEQQIIAFLTSDNNDVDVTIYHSKVISDLFVKTIAAFICDRKLLESTIFGNCLEDSGRRGKSL